MFPSAPAGQCGRSPFQVRTGLKFSLGTLGKENLPGAELLPSLELLG